MATRSPLTLAIRPDGVAVVTMDVHGAPVNTLRADFSDAFEEMVTNLESRGPRAVVFRSAKPDGFIAGADIKMLERVRTVEEAADLSRTAQAAFARLEALPFPVVAAIHGACLGGGLELALACRGRVASDDPKTQLGLPECQLGLVPGAGGTQRLPRLIGIAAALDLMLTGKKVSARSARKLGLVDEVVPAAVVLEAAARHALQLAASDERRRGVRSSRRDLSIARAQQLALEGNPMGRKVLFQQARKNLLKTTKGNYPAQERIIDIVELGYARSVYEGLGAEAEAFGRLVVSDTAEALIGVFQGMTALKSESGVDDPSVQPRAVRCVGVIGAGLMGAGVAFVTADKADADVRLKDADDAGVARGLASVAALWEKRVTRRKLSRQDADRRLMRVTGTTTMSGFGRADVVIEAVPEVLSLKHRVLREVEAACGPATIFASNTSSLPIADIARASARPKNVVGMHYFSPVEKMPLLEVIVTPQTAPDVTATVVALGKAQGKTVIVVNDGPGFYTSRILAPYMNEAAYLLSEGVPIDRIDRALTQWGFPVGPMTLLDEVGIDVASKVGPVLVDAFGARMEPPGTTDALIADGRLGRKARRGLYRYDGGARRGAKTVDDAVYGLLGVQPTNLMDLDLIAERCALQMINEAALCLEEGVVRSARDGDIGAVFGLGFPPFRGGPFRFVDQMSASRVVERLRAFESDFGLRFRPAESLRQRAEHATTFHPR